MRRESREMEENRDIHHQPPSYLHLFRLCISGFLSPSLADASQKSYWPHLELTQKEMQFSHSLVFFEPLLVGLKSRDR